MNIYDSHLALKQGKISSFELTQKALKAAESSNTNAYITLNTERALKSAKEADVSFSKNEIGSYLQGIPYSLKDVFITKDIKTTGGSNILFEYVPDFDGYIAQKMSEKKAVLIGKVSCDEFGMGSTNENTPFGAVKNPHSQFHVPGGSSGGSAASVAEGSCAFSIATDTGGSIRQPANFCGVVGFKPTHSLIPRFGQIAYGDSLEQAGPIANSVIDLACVMEEIVPDKKLSIISKLSQVTPHYLKDKKIGFSPEFIEGCEDKVRHSLLHALEVFKNEGAVLEEVKLPSLNHSVATYYLIVAREAARNLRELDGKYLSNEIQKNLSGTSLSALRRAGFGAEARKRILLGEYIEAHKLYEKALRVRELIREDFNRAFSRVDAIFSPVCASTAFKLGESKSDPIKMYLNDLYTIPVNLAGLPGLALPFGKIDNLPTGFQLIGNSFQDEKILMLGRSFELSLKMANF